MKGHDQVINRIQQIPGYAKEFAAAFGPQTPITIENAVEAIAAFERTLITPNSPFDQYLRGDQDAMSVQQVRGMNLFEFVGCTECHSGPALNGWEPDVESELVEFPRYVDSPLIQKYDLATDLGRSRVSGDSADDHYFKTPTLRNITVTAPYLHNGRVSSLAEACRVMAESQLDVQLSEREVVDLLAFFESLEGTFLALTLSRLPTRAGETVVHTIDQPRTESIN